MWSTVKHTKIKDGSPGSMVADFDPYHSLRQRLGCLQYTHIEEEKELPAPPFGPRVRCSAPGLGVGLSVLGVWVKFSAPGPGVRFSALDLWVQFSALRQGVQCLVLVLRTGCSALDSWGAQIPAPDLRVGFSAPRQKVQRSVLVLTVQISGIEVRTRYSLLGKTARRVASGNTISCQSRQAHMMSVAPLAMTETPAANVHPYPRNWVPRPWRMLWRGDDDDRQRSAWTRGGGPVRWHLPAHERVSTQS